MESVLLSAILVLVMLIFVSSPSTKISGIERRLARLERRLDLLLEHLGVEEPEAPGMERVRELLRQGKKIEAIKVYRQLTGEGLKESKDAVEKMDGLR